MQIYSPDRYSSQFTRVTYTHAWTNNEDLLVALNKSPFDTSLCFMRSHLILNLAHLMDPTILFVKFNHVFFVIFTQFVIHFACLMTCSPPSQLKRRTAGRPVCNETHLIHFNSYINKWETIRTCDLNVLFQLFYYVSFYRIKYLKANPDKHPLTTSDTELSKRVEYMCDVLYCKYVYDCFSFINSIP